MITTGGSGGHVIPATILYDHLIENNKIIISTDNRGLKFLNHNQYQFEIIDTPKLGIIFILPLNLLKFYFYFYKIFFFLKNKKIEKSFLLVAICLYQSFLQQSLLKLDIYLIEPNQVLGRANRFFLKSCKKIFCYDSEIKKFPKNFRNKMIIINPLVKEQIYNASKLPKIMIN